ncbi:recombinase family protein [Autumnicola musiva]|uniref:Recombinase family protein n=1 Tax=Autumnicola musiva TaxID=3075589 RepID=A0ABU3D0P8_9FLAO|nr:recombinase family protein [Zunongwangia sp. F117]MDT0675112.1 recombinase family protein [Zunongwangia sp. F117]
MPLYFYSRVSTAGQNLSRQTESFKKITGFKPNNLFVDKVQGNIPFMERPEAVKLFDQITSFKKSSEDITVYIDSIDRLGRNLIDILHTIELFTQNGINVQSNKEGFQTIINGKENPIAKVVVSVMGSIAEMERSRIKERTREGIQIAKAKGKFKGRKPGSIQSDTKLLERHPLIVAKLKKGMQYRDIADITGKSTATVAKVKKVMITRSLFN